MNNENTNKGGKIVLLIFLLICSGLGIAAFTMSFTKKCGEGFVVSCDSPCPTPVAPPSGWYPADRSSCWLINGKQECCSVRTEITGSKPSTGCCRYLLPIQNYSRKKLDGIWKKRKYLASDPSTLLAFENILENMFKIANCPSQTRHST